MQAIETVKKPFGRHLYTLYDIAGTRESAVKKKKVAAKRYRLARVAPVQMPSGDTMFGIWVCAGTG